MQTTLDCQPCFLKQALNTARLSTADKEIHKKIMREAIRFVSTLDFSATPPENSIALYEMIARISGCPDPYAAIKRESNNFALQLKNKFTGKIDQSLVDPLLGAFTLSIAGNIIDYGSQHNFDIHETIDQALSRPLAINDYDALQEDLKKAETIVYLADNCGELVFDGIVIERLQQKVVLAVKEKAIINDALAKDAAECGLDGLCQIISNGTNCPGTPLSLCSEEFLELFNKADLIISKGQGNFETLSEIKAPIYFLLTIKCPVVRDHVNILSGQKVKTGEMVLMKGRA